MPRPAAVPARRSAARPAAAAAPVLATYLAGSRGPLTALLFVLPFLVLHELGVQRYATLASTGTEYRVTAFSLLTRFLHSFGASGRYLPALAVVAVLLTIHIAQRDRWVLNIPLLPLMAIESLAWAVPLVAVFYLFAPHAPTFSAAGEWKLEASLYVGAGLYEEFVFRLAGFALLSFVLIDIARFPRQVATLLIVVTAAAAFSAYHLWGGTLLSWQSLVFIGLRGVYYGIIFLERGFGITVGVHTAYDLLFLALREASER